MPLNPTVKSILRPVYRAVVAVSAATVRGLLAAARAGLGSRRFVRMVHFVGRHADTTMKVAGIRFDVSHEILLYRAETLMTKEPDTIAWLDDFVRPGDGFYDVGANVGVYTLYAAMKRQAKVIAFEPSAENYAILNRNIHLNGISEQVLALNLAMHDRTMISTLNLSALLPGKAGHGFSVTTAGSDFAAFEPEFRQGMLGFRLDELATGFDLPFPNHVKIDVDGNDPLVLAGMERILGDARLRSIAIELNPDLRQQDRDVAAKLQAHGFVPLTGDRYRNEASIRENLAHNFFFVRQQ